jgi:hypothetical protein
LPVLDTSLLTRLGMSIISILTSATCLILLMHDLFLLFNFLFILIHVIFTYFYA